MKKMTLDIINFGRRYVELPRGRMLYAPCMTKLEIASLNLVCMTVGAPTDSKQI
jgi:hypothetical protein